MKLSTTAPSKSAYGPAIFPAILEPFTVKETSSICSSKLLAQATPPWHSSISKPCESAHTLHRGPTSCPDTDTRRRIERTRVSVSAMAHTFLPTGPTRPLPRTTAHQRARLQPLAVNVEDARESSFRSTLAGLLPPRNQHVYSGTSAGSPEKWFLNNSAPYSEK